MHDLQDVHERYKQACALRRAARWQDVMLVLSGSGESLNALPDGVYLLAEALSRLGRPESAREAAVRALDLFRHARRTDGMLRAATLLGIISFEVGSLAEARSQFQVSVGMAMAIGDQPMLCRLWNNLGAVNGLQDDHDEARRCYEHALAICAEMGDAHVEAETLQNLGILHRDRGDLDRADDCFARAAEAARTAANHVLVACALVERAQVAQKRGDSATAERLARMALLRFDTVARPAGMGEAYKLLGVLTRERGAWDEARAMLDRARQQADLAGNALLLAELEYEDALLLQATGEGEEADQRFEIAAVAFAELGSQGQAERARAHRTGG